MTINWDYQKPYPGGPAVTTCPLPRPLYYKGNPSGYTASEPDVDVQAAKRCISRAGRWVWSDNFSPEFTKEFAVGKAGGAVKDSGVAGYQRQQFQGSVSSTGFVGEKTFNSWRNARIPEGLPHAGEPIMDATAVKLFEQAYAKYKGNPTPPSSAGPLSRKQIPSPNYSSRGGTTVRLIVIHTAEGATTIESLGSYFASSSSGVSSHVGIDDKAGVIGEFVKRGDKAWTQGNANPVAVSAELCAFAEWSAAEWDKHQNMLSNCARWIAEEAAYFDLPLTRLTASQAQGSGRGVCQHADLGSWGGGHWDCGSSFPIDDVIAMAKGG